MNSLMIKADRLIPDSQETYNLKKTFFATLKFIHENDWTDACHATSAIMYILLKEQGFDVKLYIGEVQRNTIIFNHSWLELDGKIIDAAISNTLIQGRKFSPVLESYELDTESHTLSNYSFTSGSDLNSEMALFANVPLGVYMRNFHGHPQGLWGITIILAKIIGLNINIDKIRIKYNDEKWSQKT